MTRISAIGDRGSAGFTLVELLVVVFILSLLTGAVLMAAPDRGLSLASEAERLAARLVNAKEEAVLTGRTIEVQITQEGYAFSVRRGAERVALTGKPFAPVGWQEETVVVLADAGEAARIGFDPTGLSTGAEIDLYRNDGHERILVDAAGAVRIDEPAR